MTDVFICASDADSEIVRRVSEALESEGFSVESAGEKPLSGDGHAMLALWSPSSARMRRVRKKAAAGLRDRSLIPAIIEDVEPPPGFRRLKTADLRGWSGDPRDPNWLLLIDDLRRRTGTSLGPAPVGQTASSPDDEDGSTPAPKRHYAAAVILAAALAAAIALSVLGYFLIPKFLPGYDKAANAAAEDRTPTDDSSSAPAVDVVGSNEVTMSSADTAEDAIAPPAIDNPAYTPSSGDLAPARDSADSAEQENSIFDAVSSSLAAEANSSDVAVDTGAEIAAADEADDDAAPVEEPTTEEETAPPPAPGDTFKDCENCPEMVVIAPGSFSMGSPDDETSRDPTEGPVVPVTIRKPFAIGRYEVTFAEWDACVASGGCEGYEASDPGWGRGDRPVVNVSWRDARAYVDWLSKTTGETYRLPTEEEWEYVAHAGADTPFSFGATLSPDKANYDAAFPYAGAAKGASPRKTLPVGSFKPNPFGVYDMHGNAWEWVSDCWHTNHIDAPSDGSAVGGDCISHVLKGGAWNTGGWRLRAAHRIEGFETRRDYDNGFRVVRELH